MSQLLVHSPGGGRKHFISKGMKERRETKRGKENKTGLLDMKDLRFDFFLVESHLMALKSQPYFLFLFYFLKS